MLDFTFCVVSWITLDTENQFNEMKQPGTNSEALFELEFPAKTASVSFKDPVRLSPQE